MWKNLLCYIPTMWRPFFNQAELPIPEGFTDKDVDINAPRLFTDEFYFLYLCGMSKAGMLLTFIIRV